jgi:hypothetical protein
LEKEFYDTCEFLSFNDQVDNLMDMVHPKLVTDVYGVHSAEVSKVPPKFKLLTPLFGWAPADTIKRTFDVTTQYARGRVSDTLKQYWRSQFPACNVFKQDSSVTEVTKSQSLAASTVTTSPGDSSISTESVKSRTSKQPLEQRAGGRAACVLL